MDDSSYTVAMTRTYKKVRYKPKGKVYQGPSAAADAARDTENALRMLEGRWKLIILFHLFVQAVMRFSELERAIPGVSQKMLIQQLRELEKDGIVRRTVHPQVPPKVEYALTPFGQALCPALDAVLKWAALRESAI
jgi:DNA-binding HxlR family transcriptional regulator